MRLSKPRIHSSIGMNLTPMIDIVFLLIIFFITVSQITPVINHPLELPETAWQMDTPPPVQYTINIDQEGRYWVTGTEYEFAALRQWLRDQRSQTPDSQSIQVLIRCDRRAASRAVNQLIPIFTELGMTQVRISVLEQR